MVVTDLNMPVMNGLCFIRELRKLSAYNGVPIVFLTTESDPAMKQQAKAAGATGWITKPFQQAQLATSVETAILYDLRAAVGYFDGGRGDGAVAQRT